MNKFVNELSAVTGIKRKDLLEKDVLLHKLLFYLSKEKYFYENYLFKGGTSLIKGLISYYRFSEDADFTWINQNIFVNKSQKEIKKMLSKKINEIGFLIEKICSEINLDFKLDKSNKKYVEIGGSNKMVTFKIWYYSNFLKINSFIKLQINFVEKIIFPKKELILNSLLKKENIELKKLFPKEYEIYCSKIKIKSYDIKEIACEKLRALLTRRGIKYRDVIDLYFIFKKFNIHPKELIKETELKTKFSLSYYEKYRINFKQKSKLELNEIIPENEEGLLLKQINKKELYKFTKEVQEVLKKLRKEIKESTN